MGDERLVTARCTKNLSCYELTVLEESAAVGELQSVILVMPWAILFEPQLSYMGPAGS